MDFEEENQGFVTRLEQLKRNSVAATCPSTIADVYRGLYLHLRERNVKGINRSVQSDESSIYLKKHADVVDCMDDSGLNNFAEGALALCSHHKNESAKWQSSLSVENILHLPAFQDNGDEVEEDELDEDPIIPLGRETTQQIAGPSATSYDDMMKCAVKGSSNQIQIQSKNLPHHLLQGRESTVSEKRLWNQVTSDESESNSLAMREPSSHHFPFPTTDVNKTQHAWEGQGHRTYQPRTSSDINFSFKSQPCDLNTTESRQAAKESQDEANAFLEINSNRGNKPWQTRDDNGEGAEEEGDANRPTIFKTAKQQFIINQQKKFGNSADTSQVSNCNYGSVKKSLGTRRGPASKFVPPVLTRDSHENESPKSARRQSTGQDRPEEPMDERLKGIDPKMIELINNEIMDHGANITWGDVAGLEFAKKTIKEIVVWPMLRPDIFTGLRGPPKGLLLFGPPGTGKTLIGKCIASQSKSTFFCISASSLTSKWVGEGEKMVRALFAVARCNQPAVVFIDEIDSLLSQRSDGEHESSRRIKTEFLVQLDGAATASDDRILVIGATNRPQEIDEAARRRFVKRLLIPLPEAVARKQIIVNLMRQQKSHLSEEDINDICANTDGYSGADMSNLCREAALGPIRSIPFEQMETITPEQVRPILYEDFKDAMLQVRASVSAKDLELYIEWNKTYGSFGCS